MNNNYDTTKCDKYDYIVATGCGVIAGLIDSFLVGSPKDSVLGKWTDEQVDKCVIKFAQKMVNDYSGNDVQSAIGVLENNFNVNYDQIHSKDVNNQLLLTPRNHHMKSLAHSPSPIGLFFSIMNQFTSTASFVSDGQIITIHTDKFELQGNSLISKLFCGFVNWLGHLMSDVAGSSTSRAGDGRGSGIVMPFYELFGLCNFGRFGNHDKSLASLATMVFSKGYDMRFGITMSIPVVCCDLCIRLIWSIRQKFQYEKNISECIPNDTHESLRVMLLIGNGTFCAIDSIDALIRSKGSLLDFCLHINIVAWYKLVKLSFREICIRHKLGMAYLEIEYQRINNMLDEHLLMLKSIDIDKMDKEIYEFKSMNETLYSLKTEKDIADYLYSMINSYNLDLPFNNHQEFIEFMNSDEELII